MQRTVIHILYHQLESILTLPLTRERIIDYVNQEILDVPHELPLVITELDEDELAFEVAAIELNSSRDGNWRLQYLSHPARSQQLTASVIPQVYDFEAFCESQRALGLPRGFSR
ncbi:hypothetical protein [Herbaspirillum sp. B65]|uniref:hypothetical protein n=1 Tax=Herbaspirillum sp. B65 TaxID=137708 RepID=UPI0005C9C877|nr:hypothetical protein [Herbaspirillum sp. B65]